MVEDPTVGGSGPLLLGDYRRLTRLYCMNGGHHLQILPDGTVQGQRDEGDAHGEAAALRALTSRSGLQRDAFTSSAAGVSGSSAMCPINNALPPRPGGE